MQTEKSLLVLQRSALRVLARISIALVTVTGACSKSPLPTVSSKANSFIQRTSLSAIYTGRGLTGRSQFVSSAGEVILLHYPLQATEPSNYEKALGKLTDNGDDDGEIVGESEDPWAQAAAYSPTTFNCCTHAVGDHLGLTARDWVEPVATDNTRMTNPMKVILQSYYQLIRDDSVEPAGIPEVCRSLAEDDSLRDGDIIGFWREQGHPVGFVHVGRVIKRNGKNWMISKMGSGPILITTIELAAAHFDFIAFDSVQVYRLQ